MAVLTDKQERFCQEVAAGESYTTAAIRAGYSPNTATVIGWENMRKPYLLNRINEIKGDVSQNYSYLIDEAVKTLFTIMTAAGANESARTSAAEKILKLTGAMVDRTENKNTNELTMSERLERFLETVANENKRSS